MNLNPSLPVLFVLLHHHHYREQHHVLRLFNRRLMRSFKLKRERPGEHQQCHHCGAKPRDQIWAVAALESQEKAALQGFRKVRPQTQLRLYGAPRAPSRALQ